MRGIVLAGEARTRLGPITKLTSKQRQRRYIGRGEFARVIDAMPRPEYRTCLELVTAESVPAQ